MECFASGASYQQYQSLQSCVRPSLQINQFFYHDIMILHCPSVNKRIKGAKFSYDIRNQLIANWF